MGIFAKEDIIVPSKPGRLVEMNQDGANLALSVNKGGQTWTIVTPEELAYVMLSASGQFVERFNAEIERLQKETHEDRLSN